MARPNDTSPEAEQVLREVLRRMPFARRWREMGGMYQTGRLLHAAGFRLRNPGATDAEIQHSWMLMMVSREAASELSRRGVRRSDECLPALETVLSTLDRLGIPHAVTGAWASSLFGKMRFTRDGDVVVEPLGGKEAEFCASFGEDYSVSLPAVQDAARRRSSFHVLHLPSGFKVELFVRGDRPFDHSVMARRQPHPLSDAPGETVAMVSPEDIILLKLEWYRLGEASEEQWRDVLGVFEIQASQLDQAYLDHWAADLGVADLLQRARQEAAG